MSIVRCAFSKDDWLPNAMFRPLIQVSRETDAALAVTSYLYADSQQASFKYWKSPPRLDTKSFLQHQPPPLRIFPALLLWHSLEPHEGSGFR